MIHLEHPLTQQAPVDLLEIVVRLTGSFRRGQQHSGHALEILQSHARRANGIGIADGLGQLAWIGTQ